MSDVIRLTDTLDHLTPEDRAEVLAIRAHGAKQAARQHFIAADPEDRTPVDFGEDFDEMSEKRPVDKQRLVDKRLAVAGFDLGVEHAILGAALVGAGVVTGHWWMERKRKKDFAERKAQLGIFKSGKGLVPPGVKELPRWAY